MPEVIPFIEINPDVPDVMSMVFRRALSGFAGAPFGVSLQAARGRNTLQPVGPIRLRFHAMDPGQAPLVMDFAKPEDLLYCVRSEDGGPAGTFDTFEIAKLRGFAYDLTCQGPEAHFLLERAYKATGHCGTPREQGPGHIHFASGGIFFTRDRDASIPKVAMPATLSAHVGLRARAQIARMMPAIVKDISHGVLLPSFPAE